jgi:hypothetical protein
MQNIFNLLNNKIEKFLFSPTWKQKKKDIQILTRIIVN